MQALAVGSAAARAIDAAGHYRVEGLFGAGLPARHCPDLQVEFAKPGYRTVTLANPGDVKLEAL